MNRTIKRLEAEIERLKRGDFTEEEFQNLCHKFSEHDKCKFFVGCAAYQKKLFGISDREEFIKLLDKVSCWEQVAFLTVDKPAWRYKYELLYLIDKEFSKV